MYPVTHFKELAGFKINMLVTSLNITSVQFCIFVHGRNQGLEVLGFQVYTK